MAIKGLPSSAKVLRRVGRTADGAILLEDADGKRSTVSEVVSDKTDGITADDYDFESGKQWAGEERKHDGSAEPD